MDFSFSDLNFNSVENLPGFEARAAFTVNSACVFREDVDIVPTVVDETTNCFNVWDTATLPVVTKAKTDVERSTAIINGKSLFYNQSTTKTYEVEAEPLSSDEAEWIDQLFTSYEVFRIESDPTNPGDPFVFVPILITESTCETNDGDTKLNSVKFSWRYTDNRPMVRLSASPDIFTSPYNIVFS